MIELANAKLNGWWVKKDCNNIIRDSFYVERVYKSGHVIGDYRTHMTTYDKNSRGGSTKIVDTRQKMSIEELKENYHQC